MVTIGIDAHKRTHTVVVVDEQGRRLAQTTTAGTTSGDHLQLLTWVAEYGHDRLWAVEDCRHLSRRLERDLLAAGERIVRVPPKLLANARDGARTFGKSDPIARRRAQGDGGLKALRILKRRLSDVVYRTLKADAAAQLSRAARLQLGKAQAAAFAAAMLRFHVKLLVELAESLRAAPVGGPRRLYLGEDALAEHVAGASQRERRVGMKALEMRRRARASDSEIERSSAVGRSLRAGENTSDSALILGGA
jgi:transposase